MRNIFIITVFISVFLSGAAFAKNCEDYFNAGHFVTAASCYNEILKSNPKDGNARFGLAASLYNNKQYTEAYNQYMYIVNAYPNSEAAELARKDAQKAREQIEKVKQYKQNDTGDYLNELEYKTVWRKMPIKVWIQRSPYSPYAQKALYTWQQQTSNIIRFQEVDNDRLAQIKIYFVDEIKDGNSSDEMGLTQLAFSGTDNVSANVQILQRTPDNKMAKYSQVYQVLLHEIGHAVGISGHSSRESDLMYPNNSLSKGRFTNRDINTIRAMYKNVENSASENTDKTTQHNVSEGVNPVLVAVGSILGAILFLVLFLPQVLMFVLKQKNK